MSDSITANDQRLAITAAAHTVVVKVGTRVLTLADGTLNYPRIERLAAGKTSVTPDTALRLAKYLGTSPELWMNMQAGFDLKIEAKAKQAALEKIRPPSGNRAEARTAA